VVEELYATEAAFVAPEVRVADIVLPNQTNTFGTMFGGNALALMDKAAAIAAWRFCRQPVVTASTEHIDFRAPVHQGEIVEAMARVIYAGRTSLVVRVHVYGEHPFEGERRLCTTGYFSMVSVGPDGRSIGVPRLIVEDDEAREEWPVGERIHKAIITRRAERYGARPKA